MSKEQLELEKNVYEQLRKPFPLECYSVDSSRGFDLSSLKAIYIPIRLNEVLGVTNWVFDGHYESVIDDKGKKTGTIHHGVLTIQVGERTKVVKSAGYSGAKKNVGDELKGSYTDSLSKCASYLGVAEQAFCGLVDPEEIKKVMKNKKSNNKTETKGGKPSSFSKKESKDLNF